MKIFIATVSFKLYPKGINSYLSAQITCVEQAKQLKVLTDPSLLSLFYWRSSR